jgi:hypothetical protein
MQLLPKRPLHGQLFRTLTFYTCFYSSRLFDTLVNTLRSHANSWSASKDAKPSSVQQYSLLLVCLGAIAGTFLLAESCQRAPQERPSDADVQAEPLSTTAWLQNNRTASYRFCGQDTVGEAMTIDILTNVKQHDGRRADVLNTTTILHSARTLKSEAFRRSKQGLMRLLPCTDEHGKHSSVEVLVVPHKLQKGAEWVYRSCTGDTIGFFRLVHTDTTITVPAGTFRVFSVREIDNTGIMSETFISPRAGIVKITMLRSRLIGTRHRDDPSAMPFESFELVRSNSMQR